MKSPRNNKILAIDIGQGTQDILLYDASKNIENCISLILPSPTTLYGRIIEQCSQDLYIHGYTIGGGIISRALQNHIKKGYAVFMEPEAAASIRDNLEHVRKQGIIIGKPPDRFNGRRLLLREVMLSILQDFLSHYSETLDVNAVAVAVQDHGVSGEGKSDRIFRFEVMAKKLMENNRPENFAYRADEVPQYFTRMTSLVKSLKEEFAGDILVMDTALCAVLGCMEDAEYPSLIVNVGNDHTLCVIARDKRIDAFMEHHTGMLNPGKLRDIIERFSKGLVTSEEIYDDGGHGAFYVNRYSMEIDKIIVTGPHREMIRATDLPVVFSAPGGNMMLTGPIGLVKALQFCNA